MHARSIFLSEQQLSLALPALIGAFITADWTRSTSSQLSPCAQNVNAFCVHLSTRQMTTELPFGGEESCCKPASFHHGLMDLCTGANGTLLTFPVSPALRVCRAWSVNKPVGERGYLGDTTTITFHLFCVHTRFINLCTLSPLRPSCACSPAPGTPWKIYCPWFYVVLASVCVFVDKKDGTGGKRQMNGAQINSHQTDLIQFLIIACR